MLGEAVLLFVGLVTAVVGLAWAAYNNGYREGLLRGADLKQKGQL